MSSYFDDEEDLDIRIHRGRASPAPVVYPDPRRPSRPVYYTHGSSYLVPEHGGGRPHRSSSSSHRPLPPQAPVIINNRIYNDYDEDDEEGRYLQLARPIRSRSRSRSRPPSFASSAQDYELEKTRAELEKFKMEAHREKEKERLKKELELKKLKEEKAAKEEAVRAKKEAEEAVEKFKIEEAKKREKEKKEKEERETEYKHRLEDDLRKSGMDERQIAVVLKKDQVADPNRPTYTRMSRRHLSIETLNRYRIDYEFDSVRKNSKYGLQSRSNMIQDPDYLLIKRWVPEYEQDFLWSHTSEIRERRSQPVILAIEGKKKHHEEPQFEFVRKKKHERKPSPSHLLTFLAGGKR
jgi:hypothetical protein